MSTLFIHYVYAYLRKNGTPYYIGKGKNGRAFNIKGHSISVPKDKSRIIFLETNLSDIGALALERRYIKWYGRKDNNTGILRNMTDGGDGSSGVTGYWKNKTFSDEHRRNVGLSGKNRVFSIETRIKIGEASKKRGAGGDSINRRMKEMGKIRTHTSETRKKLSIAAKGQNRGPLSEETKKKISEIKKGKLFSDEHKRNLSKARKLKRLRAFQDFGII